MFHFFKKKKIRTHEKTANIKWNYESIKVDMHSHVLPSVDDGAPNAEESIALIKELMALGIEKIIATPHIMADYYKNTFETIHNALNLLKSELHKQEIIISIEAAAEYLLDENFEDLIQKKRLLTMANNYVLFELPFISRPKNLYETITNMQEFGYKPILAHPERYSYLSLTDYRTIRNRGCNMQLNTISFTGYYGQAIKTAAEQLTANGLVDFISSDMHHLKHAAALSEALKTPYVKNLLQSGTLKNIFLL